MKDNGVDENSDPEDYTSIVVKGMGGEEAKLASLAKELEKEQEVELITSFEESLLELVDPDLEYTEAQNKIAQLQAMMLPQLFRESFQRFPNVDKSVVTTRTASILKDMSNTLKNKRDAQVKADIDPHSPKFETVFGWFIEIIQTTMEDEGFDEIQISNFFSTFAGRIPRWQDRVSTELKGLANKALQEVKNPFVEDFVESVKKSSKDE